AHKIVTAKDRDGNMITREITVEGPVTIAIPTIRNKTDEQLQTRLLVAELEDYEGRVGDHSRAFSRQLLPEAVAADYSREQWLWHEALRQLTARRRVVFPLGGHEGFAFNDGGVSHGARLWANLLSLMLTHAWLEQRNREIITLSSGEEAIVATPEDYVAAYDVFTKVCQRSVVNLSNTHRKILTATHNLTFSNPESDGFSQRQIAKEAGVSPQTISNNKTFLVMSAKMLRETEHGLALVAGVVPEEWAKRDLEKGLPSPEMVWTWWAEREGGPDDDPSSGRETAGHRGHRPETGHKAHTYGGSDVQSDDGHPLDVSTSLQDGAKHPADGNGHVQGLSISQMDAQNRIDKPNTRRNGGVSIVSRGFGVQEEIEPMLEPEEGWFDDF
ncbi:MAG: hypothetical protein ICV68_15495, partial [Pyrinomonadaceae bacterium]|nr:hypothetical protein [Pyrinomonadaceae bacterium]